MILITYDLNSDHTRVKKALKDLGWKDIIIGDNGIPCYLPNTSLWKVGSDTAAAREEVKSVVSEPTLERLICALFNSWAGIIGQEF